MQKTRFRLRQGPMARREARVGFLFALPFIAGLTVFFLIPFGMTLYYSLTDGTFSKNFVGFANYRSLWESEAFRIAFHNTWRVILFAVPLIMGLALLFALLLHKKLRGSAFFRAVFVFPLVLPTAATLLFFQVLFGEFGVANLILSRLELPAVNWLMSSYAFWVLVLLYIWKNIGFNIILFLSALNSVPKEYYEAAAMDGASKTAQFFRITLPLIFPHLFFIFIWSVLNSFKAFREAFLLCGNHPHSSIYMIQHFLNNNFANLNYVRLASAAMLTFLAIFVLVAVVLFFRKKWGDVAL